MLDTSIVSAMIRQHANVDQRLQALGATEWCISVITRLELMCGLARNPAATRLATLVHGFLAQARVLSFDERAADAAARLRAIRAGRQEHGRAVRAASS